MNSSSDPRDGFDLIEYPCDFVFKAMCRAHEQESAMRHISAIVEPQLAEGALISIKTNASRTGKFESVTLTVRLENREQLESIYEIIAASPRVVMTL